MTKFRHCSEAASFLRDLYNVSMIQNVKRILSAGNVESPHVVFGVLP